MSNPVWYCWECEEARCDNEVTDEKESNICNKCGTENLYSY